MRLTCRILAAAAALAVIATGCSRGAERSASDITSLSIGCGSMNMYYSYSFHIYRSDDGWYFDAECCTDDFTENTRIENIKVSDDDVKEVLDTVGRSDAISYVEKYKKKKKKKSIIIAADEEVYSCTVMFNDGSSFSADRPGSCGGELEKIFYSMAQKYK